MLGVLCARPKPWILNPLTHFPGISPHKDRLLDTPSNFPISNHRRHHSNSCRLVGSSGGAASIWHLIQPSGFKRRTHVPRMLARGEGSWNVAWDARPARWLHRADSAWLLFGVCACLAPIDLFAEINSEILGHKTDDCSDITSALQHECYEQHGNFKIIGMLADGRCLFRAIAHVACLRNGEEAPDENRQRELADELRAQVVNELLRRREETEWFIEEDFDAYVKRIEQPYVWGGEPELLMASHVLKSMISVFMIDRASSNLVKIANYGEEYQKEEVNPINVLFHGYGHYDALETLGQTE